MRVSASAHPPPAVSGSPSVAQWLRGECAGAGSAAPRRGKRGFLTLRRAVGGGQGLTRGRPALRPCSRRAAQSAWARGPRPVGGVSRVVALPIGAPQVGATLAPRLEVG